jgi:DnaJ-class molecular chaperone
MKKIMLSLLLLFGFSIVTFAQQDTTLAQFAGKYVFPSGSVVSEVTVVIENGALVMNSSAGSSALDKEAEDLYVIVAFQGKALFKRDNNKKIIGVSINAMGYQLEGTKENSVTLVVTSALKR